MKEDTKVMLVAFFLYVVYVTACFMRYSLQEFGYATSGYIVCGAYFLVGILLLFIRVIGQDAPWQLFWGVGSIGLSCALIQTAIVGADLYQALHLNMDSPVVTIDFVILATQAIFWSLLGAYVNEWRPYQSSNDLRYGLMTSPEHAGCVAPPFVHQRGDRSAQYNAEETET